MNARCATLVAAPMGVALFVLSGCGAKPEADAASAAARATDSAFVIPANQQERLGVHSVATTSFYPVVNTTGTVQFDGDQSTQVLAPISGPVARVLVQPGDRVTRGQALAYVSSPDFASAVADYRKAAATARNTQRVAALDSELFQNDAIARRDLEQAQTDAVSAAADRDAALEQLRALGVDDATLQALETGQAVQVTYGVIRAPIAGTLVERLITPGQLLEAGSTPCFTVADMSRMWVMANVFESDLADVHTGDAATVTTAAATDPFSGRVDNIAALVDPATKATAVRIVVSNRGRLLKKDMYVHVAIQARDARSGILVPVSAVLRDEDNTPFVFIRNARGAYEHRTVQIGTRIDGRYEIMGGLTPGDQVVSEGGLFLQFAQSQ